MYLCHLSAETDVESGMWSNTTKVPSDYMQQEETSSNLSQVLYLHFEQYTN